MLMHAAGVEPVAIQRAVAPQCCAGSARDGAQDVFLVLDGDEYFVRCRGCYASGVVLGVQGVHGR